MRKGFWLLAVFSVAAITTMAIAQQSGRGGVYRQNTNQTGHGIMRSGMESMPGMTQPQPSQGGSGMGQSGAGQSSSGMGQPGIGQSGPGMNQSGTCQGSAGAGQSTMGPGGAVMNPNGTCQSNTQITQPGMSNGASGMPNDASGMSNEAPGMRKMPVGVNMNMQQMNRGSSGMSGMAMGQGGSGMPGHQMDMGTTHSGMLHSRGGNGKGQSALAWNEGLGDLRTQIGGSDFDRLVLSSFPYLQSGPQSVDGITALLKADNDSFGGKNRSKIINVFRNKGFSVDDHQGHLKEENKVISNYNNPFFQK